MRLWKKVLVAWSRNQLATTTVIQSWITEQLWWEEERSEEDVGVLAKWLPSEKYACVHKTEIRLVSKANFMHLKSDIVS